MSNRPGNGWGVKSSIANSTANEREDDRAKSSQGFAIQVMPMGAGNLEDKRVIGSGNSEHPLRLEFVVDVMEDGEMEVKLVGVGAGH